MEVVWGRFLMTEYRRFFWILTLAAFLITATGCATSGWHPINEELEREGSGLHKESGQAITEYQLSDGTYAGYKGWVRLAAQDSLVFWEKEYVAGQFESGKWVPESRTLVPGPIYSLDEVQALKVYESNSGKTVFLAVVITAVFVVIVGGIAASQASYGFGGN